MVSAAAWFINVWINTDIEQRRRHEALVAVSDILEHVSAGVMAPDNQSIQVQKMSKSLGWVSIPGLVGQLSDDECPAIYKVTATAQLGGDKKIKVQVTG